MFNLLGFAARSALSTLASKLFWWSINKTFRKQLPKVFDAVDIALGAAQATHASVYLQKSAISRAIEKVTNSPATPEELATVLKLYDPLKAAAKLLQSQ